MNKRSKRIIAAISTLALGASVLLSNIAFANAAGVRAEGAADISYDIVKEGSVLMKNDNNALPLDENEKVALFGRVHNETIRGGTGSGNVNITLGSKITILQGIQERGVIDYYEPLTQRYVEWGAKAPIPDGESGSVGGGSDNFFPEMSISENLDVAEGAVEYADTAIVFIGRSGGEFADRVYDKDYTLQAEEREMLAYASENFDKMIVVLNIASVIDMKWVDEYAPDAILNVWHTGSFGGYAVADMLSGATYPSGKLTDTWAINYEDYPTQDATVNAQTGGSTWGKALNANDNLTNPHFIEDIYVGYRYFETFAPEKVAYEFGYGLAYTNFDIEVVDYDDSDVTIKNSTGTAGIEGEISVTVNVKNVGYAAGKEVVQIYYGAPQGKLGQPVKQLAAFAKTDELQPGQEQTLTVSFDAADMASYDDSGVTGFKSYNVLETGNYDIYVGNSVKNTQDAGTYEVSTLYGAPVLVEELSEQLAVETDNKFQRLTVGENGEMAFEDVPTRTVPYADIEHEDAAEIPQTGDVGISLKDVYDDPSKMDAFIGQLTDSEMATLTGGYSGGSRAPGAAGAYAGQAASLAYGIVSVTVADGPAGIRITRDSQTGEGQTQFPNATSVASTWNIELMEREGEMIGVEAAENGVDMLLAPGMNIHRDPLSGRNFEYYSEDPLVSGVASAAVVRGVQSKGVQVTIKHFAVNNQEQSRNSNNNIVSERAIREIYIKGFEFAVKNADVTGVMTSYPRINGSFACSNTELVTNILHNEWGFDGVVMTDWYASKDGGSQATMVRAQNDLSMSTGNAGQVTAGLENGTLTRGQLQRSMKNIVNSVMKSVNFRDTHNEERNLMTYDAPILNVETTEVDNWFDFASDARKTILADTIADAEALVGTDEYNEAYEFVRENLDNAITSAKALLNELYASDAAVVAAIGELQEAMWMLQAKAPDASVLEAYVELVEDIDVTKYNVGVEAFQKALAEAKAVLADVAAGEVVTQDEVNDAYTNLRKAVSELRYIVNKDMLIALRDKVAGTNLSGYTADTAAAFTAALANANAIILDENATDDDVDNAYTTLLNAFNALKPLSNGGGNGGSGSGDGDNGESGSGDGNNGGSGSSTGGTTTSTGAKSNPKTGESNIAVIIAAVLVLGGLSAVVTLKKRNSK